MDQNVNKTYGISMIVEFMIDYVIQTHHKTYRTSMILKSL